MYNKFITLRKKSKMAVEKESLKITFGGENEIELETLQTSLHSIVEMLSKIADCTLMKEDLCKFYVTDVKKGSVTIFIEIVKDIGANLLAGLLATGIVGIGKHFVDVLKTRQFLKGEPPKLIEREKEKVKITNKSGQVLQIRGDTFSIYTSSNDIEITAASMSKSLSGDKLRTTFTAEVQDKGETSKVEYSQEDLKDTIKSLDVEAFVNDYEEFINQVKLKVKKALFVGEAKWEFINTINNQTLSAAIEDKEFLDKWHNDEVVVTPNTILDCTLRSRTKRGQAKTLHSVLQVISVIPKAKQGEQTKMNLS